MNVEQDSGALRNIAAEINGYATEIRNCTELINAAMKNRINASQGDSYFWYGPKAGEFVTDYKNKYPEKFDNAYNNIVSMANNLESQAETWERFESQ